MRLLIKNVRLIVFHAPNVIRDGTSAQASPRLKLNHTYRSSTKPAIPWINCLFPFVVTQPCVQPPHEIHFFTVTDTHIVRRLDARGTYWYKFCVVRRTSKQETCVNFCIASSPTTIIYRSVAPVNIYLGEAPFIKPRGTALCELAIALL